MVAGRGAKDDPGADRRVTGDDHTAPWWEPACGDASEGPHDAEILDTTIANRYAVESSIARGGLGRVFRVRHIALEKIFALKILNQSFSRDPSRRQQFYREAKFASAMMHPNIISVVDFGEDDRVGAYMVMEYLEGEPLSRRLEHYPSGVPIKVFCDVMKQTAEALDHIHRQGVAHGDVKPENLLCHEIEYGGKRRRWQIKLLDFGMASLMSRAREDAVVAGTPAYLAPERIRGEPPSATADLYSLGLVGYELLTGCVPFSGPTQDVLMAQLEEKLPPVEERRGERVDERAAALIERAVAKKPADRHAHAGAFLYELRTVMHMLGMTERRRNIAPAAVAAPPDRRKSAAALGFELSPLPMAGIDTDGAISCANSAFSRFVTGDESARVVGQTLFASRLLDIYPELLADIRRVFAEGRQCRSEVEVARWDGTPGSSTPGSSTPGSSTPGSGTPRSSTPRSRSTLTFLLRPGEPGTFGDVHITVIPERGVQGLGGASADTGAAAE